MGNRGSKLHFIKRATSNGSWQLLSGLYNPCLRFTLMGYESNSPKGYYRAGRVSLINNKIKFISNTRAPCAREEPYKYMKNI